MVTRWRGLRLVAFAAFLALSSSLPGQPGKRFSISASCPPGCQPAATSFQVPRGALARSFAIGSLGPGEPCAGEPSRIKGFSIRRGGQTVLVYYLRPAGPVSDPVPLEDLELGPGDYQLFAAPAAGASVTLAYSLVAR